jgi:hypothetical protein
MTQGVDDNVCLKIGVTAHRDLSQVHVPGLERQIREFFLSLQSTYPDLPLTILNPLAPGGDILVAEIALEMGIAIEVPLPMPLAVYEADFSAVELEQFRRLCEQSTVMSLPMIEGNTEASLRHSVEARDRQYAQLGMYVAGHSHLLLALWDGEDSDALGGTASVVHYQLYDEMAGVLGSSRSEQLLADKESDLVYHIHCPRSADVEARECGRWLSHAAAFPGLDLPDRYRVAFGYMQSFRRDVIQHAQQIERNGDSLISDPVMNKDPALVHIDAIYRSADWLAIHYRKLVLREIALTHLLAALMGICFVVYSEYMDFEFLLPAFLVFFFGAWAMNKIANRLQWHRKYLDNRALAEGLRVQFYWTLADVESFEGTAFAYDNLMQKQDLELVWIRHIMRGVSVAGQVNRYRIDSGLELAIDQWIGDEESKIGQLGYYRVASFNRARKLHRNSFYGKLGLGAGISIALLLLVIGRSLEELPMNILLILMGLLPLMAGIREAYAYKKADKELTKQYQFMHNIFSRAKVKLSGGPDRELKKKVLRALGEACLEEHAEWILIHRERPLEHSGLQG